MPLGSAAGASNAGPIWTMRHRGEAKPDGSWPRAFGRDVLRQPGPVPQSVRGESGFPRGRKNVHRVMAGIPCRGKEWDRNHRESHQDMGNDGGAAVGATSHRFYEDKDLGKEK